MTVPGQLPFLRRLHDRYREDKDPAPVLGMRALGEAARLAEIAEPGSAYYDDALAAAGLLHWHRSLLLPAPDDEVDLDRALELFSRISPGGVHLIPDPIRRVLPTSRHELEDDLNLTGTECALLGRNLLSHYRESRGSEVLRTSIAFLQRALDSGSPDGRAANMQALALARYEQYQHTDAAADLDEAIALARASLDETSADDPARPSALSNLSALLRARHDRFGDPSDLDDAVRAAESALAEAGNDVPADLATNLGLARLSRFRHDRHLANLHQAVRWLEAAAVAPPREGGSARWSNLAVAHQLRHTVLADPADLNRAVVAATRAVETTPADHPDLARYLSNLALTFDARHAVTADPGDLDRAVSAATRAVEHTAINHPDLPRHLSNLALTLHARHALTADPADLVRAAATATEAVRITAIDHPDLADRLVVVAETLRARGKDDGALRRFREAAGHRVGRPSTRVAAAQAWARLAADRGDHDEAVNGFALAASLVPLLVSRELRGRDRTVSALGLDPRLAADAVASGLDAGNPLRALELWEQGRGVVLEQELQLRSDVSGLAASHPELADQLETVRQRLNASPLEAGSPGAIQDMDHRVQLARQVDRVVQKVRQLDGFEDFLRPPRAEGLLTAASGGPVVLVNISRYRSDAIVITDGAVEVVPLHDATPEQVHAVTAKFLAVSQGASPGAAEQHQLGQVLAWLWDAIAGPVFARLGLLGGERADRRRLWWCPGGELALLPLHAAGRDDVPNASVPDLVISSYTPTLRALLQGRSRQTATRIDAPILAVGMTRTPGLADLPASSRELRTLAERFPENLTTLVNEGATRDAVAAAMQESQLVHLACHGSTDPADPRASSLFLADGRLTVSDLLALRPTRADLVVLSACHTGATSSISDEPVSLASALLFAGYRDVVGTLWPVTDRAAAATAAEFYAALERHGYGTDRVAHAFDEAIAALRRQHPDRPHDWLAYIHLGP